MDDRHGAAGDDHQRDGERLRLARPGGRGHPASDLDLALLVPTQARFEPLALLALRGDLELVAGCPVELAVPDPERGLVHCKEVVAYGATLYVGDRRAVDDFEMRVLADYGGLCEERRLVVDAYRGAATLGTKATTTTLVIDATSSRTAAVNEDDVVSYHCLGY